MICGQDFVGCRKKRILFHVDFSFLASQINTRGFSFSFSENLANSSWVNTSITQHKGQVFILHAVIFFSIFEIFLSSLLSFHILSLTPLHAWNTPDLDTHSSKMKD